MFFPVFNHLSLPCWVGEFLTLISKLFLTSSCFYLWISTSNPKLLPPGPQINAAGSLPALILCILSAELHCCFGAGIEDGVGSVVLTALTKRRRNSPGVFSAIFSFPFLISLCSHFITVLPAVSFDKSRLLLKTVPSCHLPAKVQPLALPFVGFVLWCMIAKSSADIWQIWDKDLRRVNQVS